MGASWTCKVCGTDVLGSVCPHHQDWQHVYADKDTDIARLRAENARLRGSTQVALAAISAVLRHCNHDRALSRSSIRGCCKTARDALKPADGEGVSDD